VPGEATAGRNRGGHLLIRDGARLVESAADILGEFSSFSGPTRDEGQGLDHLPESLAFTVDDVVSTSGQPAHVVLARLLELELAGSIRRVEGGRFVRASGRPAS
jgi:DNA processing protein